MSYSSYWYLGLSFLSLCILIFVCFKKRVHPSIFMFLIMVQVAYLIETVIYIFGGSYEYHPHLLKNNEHYDSNMGALTSNMFIIPTLATFISAFRLRWVWIFLIIGLIAAVELLFVKLQIYTLKWWRIQYTSIGLIFYFAAAKVIYPHLLRPVKGWIHSLYLILCVGPILGTLHILPIMFFMNRTYHPGWYSDVARDTTAFSSIYYLFGALAVVALVKLKGIRRWLKFALLILVYSTATIALVLAGILEIHAPWDPAYYIIFPLLVYIIAEAISNRLSAGPPAVTSR